MIVNRTSLPGRIKFVRTQALLRERLGSSLRIRDVGGADGVHAAWLANDGHSVEVIDIVPLHVERATRRGLRACVGDARALPEEDAAFDVVLLLGPLYHLASAQDRQRCLREARRVLRPGGWLAAAGVSRLSVALNQLRVQRFDDARPRQAARRIVECGRDDTGYGAGLFYFHTPAEIAGELASAGFDEITVRGVDGPAWPLIRTDASADDPLIAQAQAVAEMADGDLGAAGASEHLLAFGRR